MLFLKVLFFLHAISFFFSEKLCLAWMYIGILGFDEIFFVRKIVTVISIFFTQFLGCFGLNLVLLTGAKLKPSKSKYLCPQMWCDNTLCAKFSTGGESPGVSTRSEKVFQSLSSLNPCRLHIDTPVHTISQKSAKLPQAAAAVTSQKIHLRKIWCLVVFGNNHTPSFRQPQVWTGVFWLYLSPNKLDVETKSTCSKISVPLLVFVWTIKLMTGLKVFILKL